MSDKIKVALADDHKLFRKGLCELISGFAEYKVVWDVDNGHECLAALEAGPVPEIVLLDIHMPQLDGYQTAEILKRRYPAIKILVLSMYDSEAHIIRMLKLGVKGYILKDAEPYELKQGLDSLVKKGMYYSDLVMGTLMKTLQDSDPEQPVKLMQPLNEREIEFIQLAATELTYKEIADHMCVSIRTIDGYRDHLFEKFHVKSRVGLVLYAIRNRLISVP